jgi:hypothetical protein
LQKLIEAAEALLKLHIPRVCVSSHILVFLSAEQVVQPLCGGVSRTEIRAE